MARQHAIYGTCVQVIPCIVSVVTRYGVEFLRQAVRQRVEAEGLRPFSLRTGIPLGQLRSVVEGRAARSTTLELIASVLELEFYIGPARANSTIRPRLPSEIARALDLPRGAGVDDAVGAIRKDAMAARLREGLGLVQELMEKAEAAAALLPDLLSRRRSSARERPESGVVMIPFAPEVRLAAGTGEVVFEESPEVSIAVATGVLASWARHDRLTCVRAAGDSMEPAIHDGDLVVVDPGRREPLDRQLFAARTAAGLVIKRLRRVRGRWLLTSDNPAHASQAVSEEDRIVGQVAWCGPRARDLR
jgi:phage repressor protein C with HTH and peptisase S24 domain